MQDTPKQRAPNFVIVSILDCCHFIGIVMIALSMLVIWIKRRYLSRITVSVGVFVSK